MPYLNLDLSYFDHRKTKRLIGLLGRGAEAIPIRLWCYCGTHHCGTGELADYSPQEIESLVGWWGKPGEMLPALLKVGFVSAADNGYVVHDFLDHNGHLQAFKIRGKAMADARWKKARDAVSNAAGIATGIAPRNAPTEPTEPTEPNPSIERVAPVGSYAEIPALKEVQAHAAFIGLAPWKAEDWFDEMSGCGWLDHMHRPIAAWRAVMNRVRTKWEADGRPSGPPAAKSNQSSNGNGAPSVGERMLADSELKRVNARMAQILSGYDSHQKPTSEDQTELNRLRVRKKELRGILGSIV